MGISLEEEIRNIAEEMIKKLSQVTLYNKSGKERFKDILEELKEDGEIINFLPKPNRKFKDFAVVVENKGKYDTVGVAVKKTKEEIRQYMKKQEQARKRISQYRRFIERFVFAVNSKTTDKNLKKQWAKALKRYQES